MIRVSNKSAFRTFSSVIGEEERDFMKTTQTNRKAASNKAENLCRLRSINPQEFLHKYASGSFRVCRSLHSLNLL